MKRFNQNQGRTNEAGESNVRPSFLRKLSRRNNTIAGAAILAVIVLHFVSPFIFFKSEDEKSEKISPKIENEQIVEVKTEPEAKKPDIETMPEKAPLNVQPEPKIAPPMLIRKKEQRESRATRLRRAEKLLTGI